MMSRKTGECRSTSSSSSRHLGPIAITPSSIITITITIISPSLTPFSLFGSPYSTLHSVTSSSIPIPFISSLFLCNLLSSSLMEATLGLLGKTSSGFSSNESKVEALEQHHVGLSSEETELELGLGLSLQPKSSARGERGRILTAKDFPSAPPPCFFSERAVSGSKRAADSGPQDGGSPPRSSQVVGWPPIRAYRMNSLVNQAKTPRAEEDMAVHEKEKSKDDFKNSYNENKNSTNLKPKGNIGFIKVSMDGIPIGRKVNLKAHACYETLAQTLDDMFFKPTETINPCGGEKELLMKASKLLDGWSEFVLTYEDKEGDWMLVGDVPWRMFVSTVKRLRIMKTSEANGLAQRVQDTNERQRRKPA